MEIEKRTATVCVKAAGKIGYGLINEVMCPSSCDGKRMGEDLPQGCGLPNIACREVAIAFEGKKDFENVNLEIILKGACAPDTERVGLKFGKHLPT